MPIVRAWYSLAMFGTSSSPIAICMNTCFFGAPGKPVPRMTSETLVASERSQSHCRRLMMSEVSSGSGNARIEKRHGFVILVS